jgi:hypothetical protein
MAALGGLSLLAFILGILIFICLLPGIITGYIIRSVGKSFTLGFILGFLGPIGWVAAIVVALTAKPRDSVQPNIVSYQKENYQPGYSTPIAVSSNSSTAWSIAALAGFVCLLAIGGLTYVVLVQNGPINQTQASLTTATPSPVQPSAHISQQSIAPAMANSARLYCSPLRQASFRESILAIVEDTFRWQKDGLGLL